jgi:hypothetical protein
MMNQQDLLRYAIVGLEAERAKIDQLLAEFKGETEEHSENPTPRRVTTAAKKRTMSEAGREAIRAAIRRRWAAFHKGKGAAPNAKKAGKRAISPAQLNAMRANAAKARAARARTLA